MSNDTNGAAAIIKAAREGQENEVLVIEHKGVTAPMLLVNQGNGAFGLHNVKPTLDAFRERPERRTGIAKLGDLASFNRHVNRFKDADSAIFVSADTAKPPVFLAVLDYHEAVNPEAPSDVKALPPDASNRPTATPRAASPRFGVHRSSYTPEFSDEWKLWTAANGKALLQGEFAALVETGARDILDVDSDQPERVAELPAWFAKRFGGTQAIGDFFASSGRMLAMAEGLAVTIEDRIGDITTRQTGAKTVAFMSETRSEVEIPRAFLLALPIFRGGDIFQIPARLKLSARPNGDSKRLEWKVDLYGVERTVKACVEAMAETVAGATGLPVFTGTPEA